MRKKSIQVDTVHGNKIEELIQLKNNHKSKYSRLALTVVTMRYNGYSNAKIIENTGLSNGSIVKHIKLWNSYGLKSIEDNRDGNKPTKLKPEMIDKLISVVLNKTPIEFGFISHMWTCNLLISYVHQSYGIKICVGTIWSILKQHKLSYKRAQTKPTKANKVEQEALKKTLKILDSLEVSSDKVMYALDETGICIESSNRSNRSPVGTPVILEKNGYYNGRFNLYFK